jgi:ABC-type multidrug transport system ATPase subunit
LPESFSREAKIARAEDVMILLGLKDVADIKVGGELVKGISGGEKRRLSLAVESGSPYRLNKCLSQLLM